MKYVVDESEVGTRLDVSVVTHMPTLSRAFIQKLCDQQKVLVNNSLVKAGYRLRVGDHIVITYDLTELEQIPEISLPILYEDEDCLVLHKPVGVLTHSKGAYNPEGTVETFLKSKVTDLQGARAGIVHRLDRATSGVIICAKHAEALSWLQKQFSTRNVKKTYNAIIAGRITPPKAIIDMPIERNPKKPQTFRVGSNGKPAVTHYETTASSGTYSLLELKPTTGRTHQLRVHLAAQQHSIVGDVLYDGQPADRLYLHARELEITLLNRERKTFTAKLPEGFMAFIT